MARWTRNACPRSGSSSARALFLTLDNRRLEAFRRAGVAVPYRMATVEEVEAETWKFTTHNEGTFIRVR